MFPEVVKYVPSDRQASLLAVRYDGTDESEKYIREWVRELSDTSSFTNRPVEVRRYVPEPVEGWDPGTTRKCLVIEFAYESSTRWETASVGMYVAFNPKTESFSTLSPHRLIRDWIPADDQFEEEEW